MESFRASRLHATAINFLSGISLTGEYQRDPVLLRDASLNNTIVDPQLVQCFGESSIAAPLPHDVQLDTPVSPARSCSSDTSPSERSGFLDLSFPIPIIGASHIKYIIVIINFGCTVIVIYYPQFHSVIFLIDSDKKAHIVRVLIVQI